MRSCFLRLVLSTCASLLMAAAFGQTYPSRPVRMEVGFPAGSTADQVARAIARKLGESWSQPALVENKPGAGGNIAAEFVAKSAADGHTLLLGNNSLVLSAISYRKLPYSPREDLRPVVYLASGPHVLVVSPSLPVSSVRQLIALARSRPGEISYASAGVGTPPHLAGELFRSVARVDITHVPYKGSTQGLIDVAGGEVAMYFAGVPPTLPLLQRNKVKALGVTSVRRSSAMPGVPTLREAGIANFEVGFWYGVFAPAKTPPQVIAQLGAEIDRSVKSQDTRNHLVALGLDPVGGSTPDFELFFRSEIERWSKLVKANGLVLAQ